MAGTHGMMSPLRWALLILGLGFIAVLAWWELRRARSESRTPGPEHTAPSDPTLVLPEMRARESLHELPVIEGGPIPPEVPVLEPPPPDAVVVEGLAEAATIEPEEEAGPPVPNASTAEGEPAAVPPPTEMPRESLPFLPPATPPKVEWPPDAERRVLALRLVAPLRERFAGRLVRQALSAEGFVLGRFDIFHKPDEEQRAVLSAASLNQPGTFDAETMDSQHYGGLSLFAVLPGPRAPSQAFEELVFTARSLNERLCGVLQDEEGVPLTPTRIALLRERLGVTPS